jgi:hypothetical protein
MDGGRQRDRETDRQRDRQTDRHIIILYRLGPQKLLPILANKAAMTVLAMIKIIQQFRALEFIVF